MKKPNFTIGVEAEKIAKKVLLTPDIESCVHVAETYMQNYVKLINGDVPIRINICIIKIQL